MTPWHSLTSLRVYRDSRNRPLQGIVYGRKTAEAGLTTFAIFHLQNSEDMLAAAEAMCAAVSPVPSKT